MPGPALFAEARVCSPGVRRGVGESRPRASNDPPPLPHPAPAARPLPARCPAQLFTCDHPGCGKSFKGKDYLEFHRKLHQEDGHPFVCEFAHCGKVFCSPKSLKKHMRMWHASASGGGGGRAGGGGGQGGGGGGGGGGSSASGGGGGGGGGGSADGLGSMHGAGGLGSSRAVSQLQRGNVEQQLRDRIVHVRPSVWSEICPDALSLPCSCPDAGH
jgi:hypothetical protein